jgi:hypothetical protein
MIHQVIAANKRRIVIIALSVIGSLSVAQQIGDNADDNGRVDRREVFSHQMKDDSWVVISNVPLKYDKGIKGFEPIEEQPVKGKLYISLTKNTEIIINVIDE